MEKSPRPASMTSVQCFEYKSLKDREIRLLSWSAGHSKPNLIHVSIDQPPKYDTLSYCWGKGNRIHPFQFQCGEVAITSSLRKALFQYQEIPSTRMLWVDALCINQSDAAEKTRQIKLMEEIYLQAETVLVSLGELSSDARFAIVLIPFVVEKLTSASEITSLDMKRSNQWYDIDPFPLFWRGIAEVNQHPWFKRLWTLQEAVLARRLRFIGDGVLIGFEALLLLVNCLYKKRLMGKLDHGSLHDLAGMNAIQQIDHYRYRLHRGLSVYDLILTIEQRECSYTKDYVYGLLGLTDKRLVQEVTTSEVSVSSLFSQATQSIIKIESSVNILKLAYNEQGLDMPSWCVNFADKNRPVDFNRGSFSAGLGSTHHLHQIETCPEFDGDTLVVSGKMFDKITAVVAPYGKEVDLSHTTAMLWISACCKTVKDQPQIPEDFLQSYAETICGGYLSAPDRLYSSRDVQAYHAMSSIVSRGRDEYVQLLDRYMHYIASVHEHTKNRAFFVTQNGHMGLGPPGTEIGDIVSILVTAEVPFVLRASPDGQTSYQLIGQAYVPGIMHGEAIADRSIGFQEVRLV